MKCLMALGKNETEVWCVDLDSKKEKAAIISLNKAAGEWDMPMLKDLLQEIDDGDLDLEITGFSQDEVADLMSQFHVESEVDADPQIDNGEELKEKWKVEPGQVWILGNHKILCGDSTSRIDVMRLLGTIKPNLMVTDPPYGVEYDADWRNQRTRLNGKTIGARAIGKVMNDDRADWTEAWELFSGNVAYVWHAVLRAREVQESLEKAKFKIRSQIIWAKNNFAIGRGDYHWKHEPCWYAVRDGKTGNWTGDRSQTTVWEIDKPQKSETGHSTQKPVECMAIPIRNNSHVGDYVYEPFSGSGTTIIACEQLGRKCLAIELSPEYVAIAIQRWADATGGTPSLCNE